jgi:hypothetical protein
MSGECGAIGPSGLLRGALYGGMVGNTYLERGRPVVIVARWLGQGTPRNVLIRREDATLVVRPFRGLRKVRVPGFEPGTSRV